MAKYKLVTTDPKSGKLVGTLEVEGNSMIDAIQASGLPDEKIDKALRLNPSLDKDGNIADEVAAAKAANAKVEK